MILLSWLIRHEIHPIGGVQVAAELDAKRVIKGFWRFQVGLTTAKPFVQKSAATFISCKPKPYG